MKIVDCEQGTPEWFAARLGKASASRMADITARTKTGWGASRANYAAELVAERLTGATAEKYSNDAMRWGTECEPQARAMYEFMTGQDVKQVGVVLHPSIGMACASPDGLVGDKGLIEIKCPNTATHIDILKNGTIDGKYIKQMMWQMICTGREWCDFVSFDPRMPPEMQIFIKRVPADGSIMSGLDEEVRSFLGEVDATAAELLAKYPLAREAAE